MKSLKNKIIPHKDLNKLLLNVEKPGRYTGGEYGIVLKEPKGLLHVAVSYPDMYEIGMSNLAVRLLYQQLNSLDSVYCERVFAPALDFEYELKNSSIPLYSLETGTPLNKFDIIGFSVGCELTLTNLLNILELGGINPLCRKRDGSEPIVIAGGPAVTNPIPFGDFVDAVFIGELEGGGLKTFTELADLKKAGASREDMLKCIFNNPAVWSAGKEIPARRTHWKGFGAEQAFSDNSGSSLYNVPYPVPNIKTVQDHGIIEIMRGCANGCRFCHAGVFYRPFRQKQPEAILQEAYNLVFGCGYREITLSSLSSGDYPGLNFLVKAMTQSFYRHRLSFSLPSLRVSSMSLELLSEISSVRKSGLTFAVETPLNEWQRGINKEVSLKRTIELLEKAKEGGWKLAKFYFMVGLPTSFEEDEVSPIIDFLTEVKSRTGLRLNVNVGAFIPKPHTPFQWAKQLTESDALDRIMALKRNLSGKGIQVRYHSPFLSLLEGVISRGGKRVGELVYKAYCLGARFDAWEELVDRVLWSKLFEQVDWDVEAEACRERSMDERLLWESVKLGVSDKYLRQEYNKALDSKLTAPCSENCRKPCGVCGNDVFVRKVNPEKQAAKPNTEISPGRHTRVLFSFTKEGKAIFLGHLNVMTIFERSFLRSGYAACFTEGYNPKPRLEFAQPLSLGIASREEIALIEMENFDEVEHFLDRLNHSLPEGIKVCRAKALMPYRIGEKKRSLMSLYWGADYNISFKPGLKNLPLEPDVPDSHIAESMTIRLKQANKGPGNIIKVLEKMGIEEPLKQSIEVVRLRLLARNPDGSAASYFDVL